MKYCPECGKPVARESSKFCDNCGASLYSPAPGYPTALAAAPREEKSPFLASLFSSVIPGLGQVYNGMTARGAALFAGTLAGLFLLLIPGLIGGSVIVEQVFAWPGLGRLGYDAILARDFPLILTINFFAAALTLAGTFLSDVLYAVVDPRIRLE